MQVHLVQVAGLFSVPMLAAIGAAAVSIPIIIHLMSRFRRRPEDWGAMRFLIEAYRKQRKRLQIEKLLLLLVRCMVVLLAGLALAGPVLSGCTRGGMVLGGDGGRVVYIVIDDALSSQTREAGTTRLEAFKDQALKVVDEMKPADRAVVLRMARPVTATIEEPTSDKQSLRKAIEQIVPRYSRGEMIDAMVQVQQSMDRVGVRDGNAVVVVLSDFPASAGYFDQPLPPELEGLGDRATLITALPPTGTDNVQVMSLTPRRGMVVAEATGATIVSGRVVVRRFGTIGQPRTVTMRVSVTASGGDVLAQTERAVTWPAGERERGANFDLPVMLPAEQSAGAGQELVVTAELLPDNDEAGLDALPADDRMVAVVRLRNQLQVALVDDQSDVNPNRGAFEPWQWAREVLTALNTRSGGTFEVTPLLPTSMRQDAIEPFDAAVVLRPDQITARGWQALRDFTDQGGLVWVFPPAVDSEPNWAGSMKRAFELKWVFADQLVRLESEGETTPDAVKLDQTTPPPAPLDYLAADWREKLGWISVNAWLPLKTEPEARWITLDTSDPALPARDKPVLMAQEQIGQGTLLFTGTPLDTRYTNLPLRGTFLVPLMHDTLRGVLGATAGQAAFVAGDQPELNSSWRGAGELKRLPMDADDNEASLRVQREGDTAKLREPAEVPGVYRGRVAGSPRLLAVNADSNAGDTIGGKAPLEKMLGGLGGWSYLNEKAEQGGVLSEAGKRADLTWALLWVLLGLVLLETFLARWFSHATDHDKPTVVGRVLGALHGGDNAAGRTAGGGA